MHAYKRSDYNNLVDAVNAVIANPPSGCAGVPALPHVDHNTILKTRNFQNIRDAIDGYQRANDRGQCNPVTWSQPLTHSGVLDKTVTWRQKVIDEIRANLAIVAACQCACSDDDCRQPLTTFVLVSTTGSIGDITSFIEGIQFAPDKCINRTATIHLHGGGAGDSIVTNLSWVGVGVMAATRVLNVKCDGTADIAGLTASPIVGGHTYPEFMAKTFDDNSTFNSENSTSFLLTLTLSIESGGALCVSECP